MNTDTPETDAFYYDDLNSRSSTPRQREFCRHLEHERNQAREQLAKAGVGDYKGDYFLGELTETGLLRQKLNQARQERDELKDALVAMVCCAESKIEPIESLYQSREILEKLKEPKSEGV